MLNEIDKQLDSLFRAYEARNGICIHTHIYLDGSPINFRFHQEDSKFSYLTTESQFSEWMANCTGDWKRAACAIEKLAKLYGAIWDNEKGELLLRFRRNEMSVAEAVTKLLQAVAVISALGPA